MDDLLLRFWPFILGAFTFVAWLVRMEQKVASTARDNAENKAESDQKLQDLEARLIRQRAEDMARKDRRDEALDKRLDGIASDIKQLLSRHAG